MQVKLKDGRKGNHFIGINGKTEEFAKEDIQSMSVLVVNDVVDDLIDGFENGEKNE